MSSFDELSFAVESFSGKVRLFPLPNLVLFPHVMQPLHIFEPRYRMMLEDALAGDQLLAMALLEPGWETNYEGRPPVYSVACLGRITSHFRLADGTYNVLLLGLRRVKLIYELDSKQRFREAQVEVYEDVYPPQELDEYDHLRDRLRQAFLRILPSLPEAQEQLDQLIETDIPLGMLTDIISYMLDIDLNKKQSLLAEIDVYQRTELLLHHMASAIRDRDEERWPAAAFPPLFSSN
jgi:Lon protease-like protein